MAPSRESIVPELRAGIANRVGLWSARCVVGIGLAYGVVLGAGMLRFGLTTPISGPLLVGMDALTLMSATPLVAMVAALSARARSDRGLIGTLAVVSVALFAGITMAVHFVRLTSGRQSTGDRALVWPSTAYALELLAWDVLLGLALVLAAATLDVADAGRVPAARRALLWCGSLCLIGTVGPIVGDMRVQFIGVVGYAVLLPVAAALVLRLFAAGYADA